MKYLFFILFLTANLLCSAQVTCLKLLLSGEVVDSKIHTIILNEMDTSRVFYVVNNVVYLDMVSENARSIELVSNDVYWKYELSLEPDAMNVVYVRDSVYTTVSYYAIPSTLIDNLVLGDSIVIKEETQGCFAGTSSDYIIVKLSEGYLVKRFVKGELDVKTIGPELEDSYSRFERDVRNGGVNNRVSGTTDFSYTISQGSSFFHFDKGFIPSLYQLKALLE